jgi:hypothetical protein
MAQPVYDDDKDPSSLSPEEIRGLEDKYATNADEAEDNAIEDGNDPGSIPNKGIGRKLRKKSEEEDAEKSDGLDRQLKSAFNDAKAKDSQEQDNQTGSLYKPGPGKNKQKNFLQDIRKRRGLLAGAGVFGGGVIALIVILLGFLNVFKLDDMMSNIDQKTFSRYNASADRRSDKWIQSYLFLRLTQLQGNGADPDSEYFRAHKVDTNNPIKDWYHTLRTSDFEKDLAKKGIVFSDRTVDGPGNQKIIFSVLRVNGEEIAGLSAGDVRSGNLVDKLRSDPSFVQEKLAEVDLNKPGGNRDARAVLKQIVNENTRFTSVLKRRQVRKSIQNMNGVKDWRFFETTRDKANNKKIDIRNKILTKAIPEDILAGKYLLCLFGVSSCRLSDDPSDPQYESDSALNGDNKLNNNQQDFDKTGKPVGGVDFPAVTEIMKQIIGKLNLGVSIIQNLDMLSRVNKLITHHEISKGVAIARGVQAMGLYQVFETSRDQMKTGQLTSAEVNQYMQVIGPISHGEGWTKVITAKGDPSKLTDTAASRQYCSAQNQAKIENDPKLGNKQFAYLCPDKQIGGASTASNLEKAYTSSIGGTLGPILQQYDTIRHLPVIGFFADFLTGIINKISGVISSLLQDVLKAVGFQDDMQKAVAWLVGKVAAFLGAGPILNGNEAAPVFTNWLVQGGAFTAEAAARAAGAAATTAGSKLFAMQNVEQYQYEQSSKMSNFDRYLSLSNPNSPAANTALAVSDMNTTSLSSKLNFGVIFKTIGTGLSSIFTRHSSAATGKGYEGTDFAAIQTFDFPKQCYNRQPISQTPQDGTNIQQVLGAVGIQIPDSDLTWDLVDGNDWYQYVYDKIGDRDDAATIAEQIYNCNLLDTKVRGGIGYVYGYTNDGGLDDNTAADNSGAGSTTTSPGGSGTLPTGSAQDLAKQLVKYLDNGAISCNGGQGSSCPDIRKTASGQSIKNASCYVDKLDPALVGMLLELAQMGHKFVLSAICSDHASNPGSLHHQGKAADFNIIDGVFMGPNDTPWSGSKLSAGKKLDQDVVSFMPKSTGFGQIQCHPTFDFLSGFVTFDDACHHQHIQVQ